jgi:hypothetical protein
MSVVDKDLQEENERLKQQLKRYVDLFEMMEKACDSDDDTEYDSSDESENDNSDEGSAEEESTDEELNPKLENDNLEVKK